MVFFYYKPIFLYNICYKIMTQIIANKLENVLLNLISRKQFGFILGSLSMDNIIDV